MARQYGSHTERSKEILAEREAAAQKQQKMKKNISIGICAFFVAIGGISVISNITSKNSLQTESVTISQTRDERKAKFEAVQEQATKHDELMKTYVPDGKNSNLSYEDTVNIFGDDPYVIVEPVAANSIFETGSILCGYQNDLNRLVYESYKSGDKTVSKEQGDIMLAYRKYVTNSSDIWANNMINEYAVTIMGSDNENSDRSLLPDKLPFSWSSSADYTYAQRTNTLPVVWECYSDSDALLAVATCVYDAKTGKFSTITVNRTAAWYDFLKKANGGKPLEVEDPTESSTEDSTDVATDTTTEGEVIDDEL